jgi:hypothetical protein
VSASSWAGFILTAAGTIAAIGAIVNRRLHRRIVTFCVSLVVLAVGIAILSSVHHPGSGSGSGSGSIPSASPFTTSSNASCTFLAGSVTLCHSNNPLVTADFANYSNYAGCTFDEELDWGDGSQTQQFVVHGGSASPVFLASHGYGGPGTYEITLRSTPSQGCPVTLAPENFFFTLLNQ